MQITPVDIETLPVADGTYLVVVYGVYAFASIGLTVWIARTLFKNGAVFLEDVFPDSPKLADAVNRLLQVGFYLLNLGYAALLLKADAAPTPVKAVETLSAKLGALLLSLGVVHFVNLYVLHRIRRRARLATLPPPVPPNLRLKPPSVDHDDDLRPASVAASGYPVR